MIDHDDSGESYFGDGMQIDHDDSGGSLKIMRIEYCYTMLHRVKEFMDFVVFLICREKLNKEKMSVFVGALELRNVEFILFEKASDSSFIASGFEDRVAGRGFIVKGWAPQLTVLRHRAVGSFVTHCGWNSTLEGVAAGVMMLAWPMVADQTSLQTLCYVIRVCEGGHKNVANSNKLARLLEESVGGDCAERVKVKELQQAAIKAVLIRDLDTYSKPLSEV